MRLVRGLALLLGLSVLAGSAGAAPQPQEGDFVIRDFHFQSGESLPELRLHYYSLGEPKRDSKGHVTNAVLLLHGTGGSGSSFMRPFFADVLFDPGGVLDPARYYIIMPDALGHGKSSKPSNGLRAHFPNYDYDDMVAAQYRLVSEGLHVDHLRLLFGTSMGCMNGFVWGETHPDFIDALMPMACLPVALAGRNRLWRSMLMQAIRNDPAWQNGDYTTQPQAGLREASNLLQLAGASPLPMQIALPNAAAVDQAMEAAVKRDLAALDANDLLYQVNASRTYDPSAKLGSITVPVLWINTADDFINPPELGIAEREVKKLPKGQFVLIPTSEQTHGHGSHSWAVLWQDRLAAFLKATEPKS